MGKQHLDGPKYQAVREGIRRAITDGTFAGGRRLPAEAALGRRFRASRNTVIRALVELRNEGLLRRVPGAGTFVTEAAPADAKTFSFVGGGAVDDWARKNVFVRLEAAIARRLQARLAGSMLLADVRGDRQTALTQATARGAAGVFYVPAEQGDDAVALNASLLAKLDASGTTVVLLDQPVERFPQQPWRDVVMFDNRAAGALLGEHLLTRGTRRVSFVCQPDAPVTVRQRLEGLALSLQAGGATLSVREADLDDPAAIRALVAADRADTIVGKDDHTAAAVMRAAYELGRRVPRGLRLAGFDDSPLARELVVPLTSVAQPVDAMADAAVYLMLTRLDHPTTPPRQVTVAGRLIERVSTGK